MQSLLLRVLGNPWIALFDVRPVVPKDGLFGGGTTLFDQNDVAELLEAELVDCVVRALDSGASFAAGENERCGGDQACQPGPNWFASKNCKNPW